MVVTSYGGKNVYLKNLTSSRFENPCIIKKQPIGWNDHSKKQHFRYGQAAGASTSNRLIYGSSDDEKRFLNTEPIIRNTEPRIRKYYTQPASDSLPYTNFNKDEYAKVQGTRVTNMFSMQERTSAEVTKKTKEAEDVSRDRERYMKEKENNEIAKRQQKEDDLKLLMSYKEPWGKPGAGAPKSDNVRTKAIERFSDSSEHSLPLGKPGAGAPMRTDSGKVKTKTNVDPEIRFQKRERGQVMDVVCPDPKFARENPMFTNLDILARKTREERHVVKRDEEHSLNNNNYQIYDPFGKPGGGAPSKDRNGNVIATRTQSLVRTVQETDPLQENAKFKNQPKWDRYLKKQTLKKDGERSMDRGKQQRYNEELEQISKQQTEKRQEERVRDRRASLEHANTWNNIWGKPGNGAPLDSANTRRKNVDVVDQYDGQLLF